MNLTQLCLSETVITRYETLYCRIFARMKTKNQEMEVPYYIIHTESEGKLLIRNGTDTTTCCLRTRMDNMMVTP